MNGHAEDNWRTNVRILNNLVNNSIWSLRDHAGWRQPIIFINPISNETGTRYSGQNELLEIVTKLRHAIEAISWLEASISPK